jgi:hypothetical protein
MSNAAQPEQLTVSPSFLRPQAGIGKDRLTPSPPTGLMMKPGEGLK